ncbi:uncharacterized protein PAF06_002785 [Gastrophryne carolinensis]
MVQYSGGIYSKGMVQYTAGMVQYSEGMGHYNEDTIQYSIMFLSLKPKYFTIFFWFVVIMSVIMFFNFELPDTLSETKIPAYLCNSSQLSLDMITPLEDKRTFIISSYYEKRYDNKHMVRVLSIVHFREVQELYCWFCCQTNPFVIISKARLEKHAHRFDFSYVVTDLLCKVPLDCHAKYLSIHPSISGDVSKLPLFKIQNQHKEELTANFTVCISTMYGNFNNVLQFIQTMEMYQILGAQRVIIYLNSCSPLMEKVMQYYAKRGLLEVMSWPIERYLRPSKSWHYYKDPKDIGYYGQMATLNDCIYRNMYQSRYVILCDIDEIILPFKHLTWDSMMEELQQENPNAGVFLFFEYTFPQTFSTNGNFLGTLSWKDVPGFNILEYVHMEPDRLLVSNNRKLIIDPRKVVQTSVHKPLKTIGSVRKVPEQIAIVHHCRAPKQPQLQKTLLIEDKTIWKFNGSLITNVNKVLREIPLL